MIWGGIRARVWLVFYPLLHEQLSLKKQVEVNATGCQSAREDNGIATSVKTNTR
jgi:hypothetical protein